MKKYSSILILLMAVTLLNCKEGDPGPQGAPGEPGAIGAQGPAGPAGPNGTSLEKTFENGFIKGTIKGTRQDGTAFEEPFEYKLANIPEGFYKVSGSRHQLDLFRLSTMAWGDDDDHPYTYMTLNVDNKGAANQAVSVDYFELNFQKLLSNRNLFSFDGRAKFEAQLVVFPISPAHNAKYKLVNYGRPDESQSSLFYDDETGTLMAVFTDTDGNKIYFREIPNTYGTLKYEYYIKPDGTKVTSSSTWFNVRYNANEDIDKIFTTTAGANLTEAVNVPADKQSISNYAYNAATGEVTFDYTINIEKYRPDNSTQNAVEIMGSVKATVYDGVVMRRSFEGK